MCTKEYYRDISKAGEFSFVFLVWGGYYRCVRDSNNNNINASENLNNNNEGLQESQSDVQDVEVNAPPRGKRGKYKTVNLFGIGQILSNSDKTIEFCQEVGLLPKSVICKSCGSKLDKVYKINRIGRKRQQYRFQCNKQVCKKTNKNHIPLRKTTWFENANISLRKSILLLYCFVNKLPYDLAISETSGSSASDSNEESASVLKRRKLESSKETVNDYYNYCREICCYIVENIKPQKIGGPGFIVEIDEAKFRKRKYNRGRVVDGNWVLGGICRETRSIFLIKVEKRDKETLIPLIEKYVEKGSTVITDCWASYQCLNDLGYKHETVDHSENFVDPSTGACTNLIENRWWCIKRQLPTTHTRAKLFDKHLMEYMWRTLYSDKSNLFENVLYDICKVYPLDD